MAAQTSTTTSRELLPFTNLTGPPHYRVRPYPRHPTHYHCMCVLPRRSAGSGVLVLASERKSQLSVDSARISLILLIMVWK